MLCLYLFINLKKCIMKKTFLILSLLFVLFSCKKEEDSPSLVNTYWSAYSYTSLFGDEKVYKMLHFISATQVEYYSAEERSVLIGTKNILSYTYTHPSISIVFEGENLNGNTYEAIINGDHITLNDYTYSKF